MTKYILYVTTAGGKIELEAEDVESAVAGAIRQEADAGREGAIVCGMSYFNTGYGYFISADHLLNGVPGTTVSEVR